MKNEPPTAAPQAREVIHSRTLPARGTPQAARCGSESALSTLQAQIKPCPKPSDWYAVLFSRHGHCQADAIDHQVAIDPHLLFACCRDDAQAAIIWLVASVAVERRSID